MITEGVAPIVSGNFAQAREEALRSALADATRSVSLTVGSTLVERATQPGYEQTIVRSEAQVRRYEIISESNEGGEYRVRIAADVEPTDAGDHIGSPRICRGKHTKRLLIGGFPLERPEQLTMQELGGYAYLTAGEVATRLANSAVIMPDHDGSIMVYFGRPERVVGDLPYDRQNWERIRQETEKHRAQYLLVGQFRSIALSSDAKQRDIVLDVLLLDAISGSCVARTRFSRIASGRVIVPPNVQFGSKAHFAYDFGKAYDEIIVSVARWAEAVTSCQPFTAHVLKSEGSRVFFDAGAEQGVAVGDSFSALKPSPLKVVARSGEILGEEKRAVGELRVTSVYPRFSIGELVGGRAQLQMGDELHSQ